MTISTNFVETHPRHTPIKFEVNLANSFQKMSKISINIANPIDFAIPIDLHGNQ